MTTPLETIQGEDQSSSSDETGSAPPRSSASLDNRARQGKAPRAAGPIVRLRPTGDGRALARTLARVLVRRALIQEGGLPASADCTIPEQTA
jgi:hypothetical protein